MNFSVLELNEDGLDGIFDSRIPICGTTENVLNVVKERMEEDGITLLNETQNPPHHVPADSPLVQTLLACYEEYTGQKGECLAIGGGTYVHHLERGVAFGCSMPGTDNRMHGADEFADGIRRSFDCRWTCTAAGIPCIWARSGHGIFADASSCDDCRNLAWTLLWRADWTDCPSRKLYAYRDAAGT